MINSKVSSQFLSEHSGKGRKFPRARSEEGAEAARPLSGPRGGGRWPGQRPGAEMRTPTCQARRGVPRRQEVGTEICTSSQSPQTRPPQRASERPDMEVTWKLDCVTRDQTGAKIQETVGHRTCVPCGLGCRTTRPTSGNPPAEKGA